MLTKLLATLDKLGLEPTAEDVADLLWLAERLPAAPASQTPATAQIPAGIPPALKADGGTPRPSLPANRREQFVTLHDEEADNSATGATTAQLYPMQAAGDRVGRSTGRRMGATLFPSAAAYALPAPLELGRSLRPLNRRIPSRTHTIIDENATAEQLADALALFGPTAGFWTPVSKPVPERWLELALVVDESSSMLIWERTLAEFLTLLERQGAFRDIQCWGLRSDPNAATPAGATVQLYAGIAASGQRDRLRQPGELIEERGQRLILVLSDCVAPIWHNGQAAAVLMQWGRHGPVALVQMLPERMWHRTGLRNYPALHLRAPQPATINRNLETFWPSDWFEPPTQGIPLPVVTLEAAWLGKWARALAGNSGLWLPGVMLHTEAGAVPSTQERTAGQLVSTFYATASPLAQQLAVYLTCAPLTLPIMRLVQRVMLPQARQVHLAEVLVSGLIVRPTLGATYAPADQQSFAFVQGVRDLLQNNLRRYEMERVTTAISTYVGERSGRQLLDFRALLADPEAEGEFELDESYQAFAEVTAAVLRRFGAQYARAAARLERTRYGHAVPTATGATPLTVGEETGRKADRRPTIGQAVTIHALLIGINQYAEPGVQALESCVTDVELTRAWLETQFQVASAHLQTLTESQATKRDIIGALQRLAEQAQAGDHVYIHYSGRDLAIASEDPLEGDGLEETLFVYDSRAAERATLLTHREVVEWLKRIDARGAQVVLFLDTCRAGSGYLCRQALDDILVVATSHEAEQSYEGPIGDMRAGYASYFLSQAMQHYRPGMTWAAIFDAIYANVKTLQPRQTLQLIGQRDLCVFSNERKPVAPYLLVTKVQGAEIQIAAHPSLALESGATLALYPPGSSLQELPLRRTLLQQRVADGVLATLERNYQQTQADDRLTVGSRVQVLGPTAQRLLTVAWDSQQPAPTSDPLLRFVPPTDPADYRVRVERDPATLSSVAQTQPAATGTWIIEAADGRLLWQQPLADPSRADEQSNQVRDLLRAIARYRRLITQPPPDDDDEELADAIELTVVALAGAAAGVVFAGQPIQVRLHNRSMVDLYISLWTLDNHLGIQRIYPPATDCLLLGKGRQIQLALTLNLSEPEDAAEQVTFKVFASRTPADLSILQQPRLAQALDLGEWEAPVAEEAVASSATAARKRPARKARPTPAPVKPMPLTILFLAANPVEMPRLLIDAEVRTIDQAMRRGDFRDRFDLRPQLALRLDDLQERLLRYQPQIVHFSGHGSPQHELQIQDERGQTVAIPTAALGNLFRLFQDNIRCVILNACYVASQATAIAQHIDCVIGISDALEDTAAHQFVAAFYRALAHGRTIETAFQLGKTQLDLYSLSATSQLQLLGKADPAQVRLVEVDD